ncbi:MAG: glycosyltransferase [Verrucomicrobia bacterium]|nr:glycosyltransferase [Verrucomicrobiota bacterium]
MTEIETKTDRASESAAKRDAPAMTVILPVQGTPPGPQKSLDHLAAQTVCDQLEVIVLVDGRTSRDLASAEYSGFWDYRVIDVDDIRVRGESMAAGVRHARAAIVALTEDHVFTEPDWAEALLRAHEGDVAAVGPVVCNANPITAVSCADFIVGYGPWIEGRRTGAVDMLPGHNSSYKREVLLSYGDRLDAMLEAETVLHWDLRSRGHSLLVEPGAVINHSNFVSWGGWVPVLYHSGRAFAGARVSIERWSAGRRLLYFLGGPLIPWVRFSRYFFTAPPDVRRKHFPLRVVIVLLGALHIDAAGQMIGYVRGRGRSEGLLVELELARLER